MHLSRFSFLKLRIPEPYPGAGPAHALGTKTPRPGRHRRLGAVVATLAGLASLSPAFGGVSIASTYQDGAEGTFDGFTPQPDWFTSATISAATLSGAGFSASGHDKLVVSIATKGGNVPGGAVTGITYDGVALTEVGLETTTFQRSEQDLFYLDDVGSDGDLSISFDAGTEAYTVYLFALDGTAAGVGNTISATAGATTPILTSTTDGALLLWEVGRNTPGGNGLSVTATSGSGTYDTDLSNYGGRGKSMAVWTTGEDAGDYTITVNGTNGTGGFVGAVFEAVAGPESSFALEVTPSVGNPGHYDFTWESRGGFLYDLVSSTDLATAPDTWPVWQGNENIVGTSPTHQLTDVPGGGDTRRFFAVVEMDPPPLLEVDFEADDGGFTSSATAGTEWAHGAPDSSGFGGAVTEGNGGSANCWGTNLGAWDGGNGDPGFYADPTTDSCLRSPDIDLTGVAGAELTFAEALDVEGGDTAELKLFNAAGDVEIATLYTASDADTNAADWAPANGGTPIDLAAGAGLTVYLQWCLSGTGGATDDYMGWYIDDVLVTVAP